MQKNMKYKSKFNVFDMHFSVNTSTEIDKKWIDFILKNYIEYGQDEKVSIFLPSEREDGFMKNHLNNLCVDDIFVKIQNGSMEKWNKNATPIPPFLMLPYIGRFLLLHGCCVCDPNEKVSLILGNSMTGKTYLSLSLIKNGYRIVTDDLVVFDMKKHCILPYSKPVGLREDTLKVDVRLGDFVANDTNEKLVFVSDVGKKTWLVHIEEVYSHALYQEPVKKIERIVFLDPNAKEIRRVGLGDVLRMIYKSIIESEVTFYKAITFLNKFFSNTTDFFVFPIHCGSIAEKTIMELDGNV